MLRRVALVLLLLLVSGAAALFAARHLGVSLPWQIAATTPEPAGADLSKDRGKAEDAAKSASGTAVEETMAALDGATEAAPPPGGVTIDISRISPDGTSVFAGRAEPDSYVTVFEDGKPAGTVKADAHGEWSLSTEHKFASTDPKLTYEASRTPPPQPKVEIAKADPAPPSAAAVAGEVMRKFENLVEKAREDAKQAEVQNQPELEKELEVAAATPPPNTAPETSESTSTGTDSSATSSASAASTTTAASETPSSDSSRTEIIPVPIMFVYNEATLTPEGQRAAALLLEYLTLKRLSAVELTGHADERGTNDYNFELSRERLETVSHILKAGGYAGELKLTPKGKSEPFMGVNRSTYSGEALFQLDRRVELRVSR